MTPRPLVLASRSPQRQSILEQLGIEFEVRAPVATELEEGPPHEVAAENAFRKATSVAHAANGSLVLGVDTVVCLGRQIYGKPADAEEARATLHALSGRRHTVIGGVCLSDGQRQRTEVAVTAVQFRGLGEEEIGWYVASGEWRERAGAYAIQGRGAALVASIEGDYLNVVGLPVSTLLSLEPGLLLAGQGHGSGGERNS